MKTLKLKKDIVGKLALFEEKQAKGGMYTEPTCISVFDETCAEAVCHSDLNSGCGTNNQSCRITCPSIIQTGGGCYPTWHSCYYSCGNPC